MFYLLRAIYTGMTLQKSKKIEIFFSNFIRCMRLIKNTKNKTFIDSRTLFFSLLEIKIYLFFRKLRHLIFRKIIYFDLKRNWTFTVPV